MIRLDPTQAVSERQPVENHIIIAPGPDRDDSSFLITVDHSCINDFGILGNQALNGQRLVFRDEQILKVVPLLAAIVGQDDDGVAVLGGVDGGLDGVEVKPAVAIDDEHVARRAGGDIIQDPGNFCGRQIESRNGMGFRDEVRSCRLQPRVILPALGGRRRRRNNSRGRSGQETQ